MDKEQKEIDNNLKKLYKKHGIKMTTDEEYNEMLDFLGGMDDEEFEQHLIDMNKQWLKDVKNKKEN